MTPQILVLEPLEPLTLSRTFIGGKDVFSHVSILPIPLQTTVVGALGAALDIHISAQDSIEALVKLIDEIKAKCVCRDPMIVGPILEFDSLNDYYVFIGDIFIPLSKLSELLIIKNNKVFIKKDLCQIFECVRVRRVISVGIALERRSIDGKKTIIPGYTYRYARVTYETSDGMQLKPRLLYLVNCENLSIDTLTRVGGEGRVARLYTEPLSDEKLKTWSRIVTPMNIPKPGLYLAINYVPIVPLKEDIRLERESPSITSAISGLEFVKRIEGNIAPLEKIPSIKVERLGIGYSEVVRARRPQILALPPGTVFTIDKESKETALMVQSLINYLWTIGFTSLLLLEDKFP